MEKVCLDTLPGALSSHKCVGRSSAKRLGTRLLEQVKKRPSKCSMCDFHDFGLIFAGQMHCLPQRLKSTLFEIFSNGGCPKGTRSVEKISNNVDFSL